jgi:uncharacterized repeat protein (TIGR01451 family)
MTPAWAGITASVTLAPGEPTAIQPSQVTDLLITLSNNNETNDITALEFSNSLPGTLPDGLKVAGPAVYGCFAPDGGTTVDPGVGNLTTGGSGTLTAVPGTQAISLTGGVIPVRESGVDGRCEIRIPVTAGSSDGTGTAYTYIIADGAVTGDDGAAVANVGVVQQSVNVTAIARPTISKSFSSSVAVLGGSPVTLTIEVANSNNIPITGFSITDTFPTNGGGAIIQVAPTPNATSVCSAGGTAGTFAPAANAVSVSATGGTIAANGSCTLTVDVVARQTNGDYETPELSNTINAISDFGNDIGIQAAAPATADIRARSPLDVQKSFSPGSLASGQPGTMTITLTNNGNAVLTLAADFDDNPIDGLGGVGATTGLVVTGANTTCVGGAGASILQDGGIDRGVRLASGAQIPLNGSCTLTANFTAYTQAANTPVTYTNTIPPGAVDVGDSEIISDNVTATILVADTLRVEKSISPSNPRPGNPVRYQVDIQNWSGTALTGVILTDLLSNGQTYLTGTVNGVDYAPVLTTVSGSDVCGGLLDSPSLNDTLLEFLVASIPARANSFTPGVCRLTFWAMVDPAAANSSLVSNQVPVGGVCATTPDICNGGASNEVESRVDSTILGLSKTFNPSGPSPEGTITRMTIALSNFAVNPITDLSISDTLPVDGSAQMRIASPANAATTCGGTLTAVANATSLSLNGGGIDGRTNSGLGTAGSCEVQVDIVAPAGDYTNQVTASGNFDRANGTASITGDVNANRDITFNSILTAQKSFSPTSVSSGGRSTVRVRLANSDTAPITQVQVTDNLPTGMVVASPSNAYTTCAGPTQITGAPGAGSIVLEGATIAGSGNCDLVFDVTATGTSDWTNTIPAGGIVSQASGVANVSPVSGTLTYEAGNNLTVAKATNPSTLTFPGETSRLTITITNGNTPVTGLSLTDFFTDGGAQGAAPNGMQLTSQPQPATTCPGGSVSATPNAAQVGVSGVALGASASCSVTVNVTSVTTGGITNTIPPNAIVTDQGLSNVLQATTSLTTATNVGVTKEFRPATIKPGERSRLRLTFYNASSFAATNLSVQDDLPTGLIVPAGPNPVSTCSGATVTAPDDSTVQVSGGTLAAASGGTAASCYVEIDVEAAAEGLYENVIPPGALEAEVDGTTVNNNDPAEGDLQVRDPLVLHKAIDSFTNDAGNPAGFTTGDASRLPGNSATLTLYLSNPNTEDAITGVGLLDELPEGLFVAATPNAATTCTDGTVTVAPLGLSVSLTGATIDPGANCTVTVDVFSNVAGTYINQIAPESVVSVEGVTNETPTQATLIVSSLPEITKGFAPPVIPPNGTSTLTIVIANDNESDMTLTAPLVDNLPTLPGAVLVAGTPSVSSTCTGAVTANAGSGSVTLANGATIPAGGCQIEVDVTAATPGQHNNNIPVGGLQTNLGTNQVPANAPLLVSTLGYISGKVFLDGKATPDGVFNVATDRDLPSVEIVLRDGADCSGTVRETTQTDAQGNYFFAELPAGTYSVCQPGQPEGTFNSFNAEGTIEQINSSGGAPGTESNPTTSSSQIISIVLGASGSTNAETGTAEVSGSPDNNFSEVLPVSVAGTVYLDVNNDGSQQPAEPGLSGVTLNLTGTDWLGNSVSDTTVTDALGNYLFDALPPGTYTVTEPDQPAGTSNGITSPGPAVPNGTAGTGTGVVTVPSVISGIFLPPDTQSVNNDFGEIPNGRSVFGLVYFDTGDTGTFLPNTGDIGIAGQIIRLTGNDINGNPVVRETLTQIDGTFRFFEVPESDNNGYTLTQPNQPANTLNGSVSAGSTGGTVTDRPTTPSQIIGLGLSGEDIVSADNLFGEVPEPVITAVVDTFCLNDAPLVSWDVQVQPSAVFPNPTLTLRWLANDNSGDVIRQDDDLPSNGQTLWPGAEVDAEGNGIAWPGWEQTDSGTWFEVPSRVRPSVDLELEINPSVTQTLSYPPATATCRTGPLLSPPTAVPVNSTLSLFLLALGLLLMAAFRFGRSEGSGKRSS